MTGKFKAVVDQKPDQPDKIKPHEKSKRFSRGFSFRSDQTVGRDRLILAKAPQGSVTYTYKLNGLVESVRSLNSDGVTEIYDYNALNLPTGISAGSQSYSLTYDAVGNLTYQTYPNGTAVTYIYDDLNRLTGLKTFLTSNSSLLSSYTYTLGPSGNRTSVTETGGRAVTWIPDDLYRLTSEGITNSTVNGSVSYVMDNVGNRLIRSSDIAAIPTQTFSGTNGYDSNDRCTATGFTWDKNGNQLTDLQGRTFTYDPLNRLTRVQGTNLDIQYVYNADNLRVKKINSISGVTTEYHWDTANVTGYPQVLEELEGGAVVCRYAYGPTGVLSQSRKVNGSWITSYFGKDAQSVRFLMDESGNITDSWTWDAYGNLLGRTGTTNCALGFDGEYMESETDLVYLRARWYDPTTGRFLQMDSFEGDQEDPQTLHKFAAFNENPMNAVDPSGHDSNGPCGGRISEILQGAFLRNYFNGQRYMPYLIDISVPGIEFIKSWEKLRLALHYDKMGNCTDIGWGHVIHRGKPDGTEPAEFRIDFNLDRAKYWLFIDLTEKMNDVREFVDVPLKQQEFDALVSLVFNTGRGTFAHSAVRMYLNQKEYDKAADAILKVGKQKGGLPTRRLMEKDIFCDGNYVMHK